MLRLYRIWLKTNKFLSWEVSPLWEIESQMGLRHPTRSEWMKTSTLERVYHILCGTSKYHTGYGSIISAHADQHSIRSVGFYFDLTIPSLAC